MKTYTQEEIEQIAKTCHSAHLAFSKIIEHPTQNEWDKTGQGHKNVMFKSIKKILSDDIKTVEESHMQFVESKLSQGWVDGFKYSAEDKINPRLKPFGRLSMSDKVKETIFFAIVKSFK